MATDYTELDEPAYPSVNGQMMPDLNLAGIAPPQAYTSTGINLTGSTPPQRYGNDTTLVEDGDGDGIMADINQMGIDEKRPYFHLNLAGEMGVPSPAQLAAPASMGSVNGPTFDTPNFAIPDMKAYDLTGPGIDHIPEFDPDPQTGDLLKYDQPEGLIQINVVQPDPMLPDLSLYDRPAGLYFPSSMDVDPLVPNLQSPTLTQEIEMPDRPGELADGAINILHDSPSYQQLPAERYEQLFMAQDGNNSHRERHMGMLDLGLEREEA